MRASDLPSGLQRSTTLQVARSVSVAVVMAMGLASCAETASSPDVLSELPGEIRQRSYAPAAIALTCSGPGDALFLDGERVDVDIAWAVDGLDAFRTAGYRVAIHSGAVEPLMTVGAGEPIQLALGYGEHRVVLQIVDQTGSLLDAVGARCAARVLVTRACETDSECDDSLSCNVTSGATVGSVRQCAFAPSSKERCCATSFDCPSLQQCDPVLNKCVQCSLNKHCADGNSCTSDICLNGQCEFDRTSKSCCDCSAPQLVAAQCDDGQANTIDSCDCALGTCSRSVIDLPAVAREPGPSASAAVVVVPSSMRLHAPTDPEAAAPAARRAQVAARLDLLAQSSAVAIGQPFSVVVRGVDAE